MRLTGGGGLCGSQALWADSGGSIIQTILMEWKFIYIKYLRVLVSLLVTKSLTKATSGTNCWFGLMVEGCSPVEWGSQDCSGAGHRASAVRKQGPWRLVLSAPPSRYNPGPTFRKYCRSALMWVLLSPLAPFLTDRCRVPSPVFLEACLLDVSRSLLTI